jgi:putative ATP-binding cassette transporter
MSQTEIVIPRRGKFLKKLWALTWPYFWSEEKWIALGLLGVIVVMTLGLVYFDVLFNFWNNDFYNALQHKDEAAFWHQMAKFFYIAVPYIIVAVYNSYLQQMLQIRWRRWMTDRLLRQWLSNRNYYRLQMQHGATDNPEQRIEQDVSLFTNSTLDLTLGFLNSTVTLVSFIGILWSLSGAISIPLGSAGSITVPGYMVWVAILYAAVGSVLVYYVGRPLILTNFRLQRSNASFRFGMSRLRENSESIAFYSGEEIERRELMQAFGSIWHYWWDLMRQTKRLNWFSIFYRLAANIFPFLVAAPRYFAGAIELGGLMQISSAFGSVQGALSWFVSAFSSLAEWKATVDRLIGFADVLEEIADQKSGIAITPSTAGTLATQNLALDLPDGRSLLNDLDLTIAPGDKVLVSGPSGSGKTTLFRALAGLWPYGKGRVQRPEQGGTLFLPQRPYLPTGSLRQALCYPGQSADFSEADLEKALDTVNLPQLKGRLDEAANWSMALSVGEQQRLAIARALLLKPKWLYLDEATAALDAENERHMYELLAKHLPDATILSIAHRPTVAQYHQRRLTIDPKAHSAVVSAIAAE